jgi:hypothetical protein
MSALPEHQKHVVRGTPPISRGNTAIIPTQDRRQRSQELPGPDHFNERISQPNSSRTRGTPTSSDLKRPPQPIPQRKYEKPDREDAERSNIRNIRPQGDQSILRALSKAFNKFVDPSDDEVDLEKSPRPSIPKKLIPKRIRAADRHDFDSADRLEKGIQGPNPSEDVYRRKAGGGEGQGPRKDGAGEPSLPPWARR